MKKELKNASSDINENSSTRHNKTRQENSIRRQNKTCNALKHHRYSDKQTHLEDKINFDDNSDN